MECAVPVYFRASAERLKQFRAVVASAAQTAYYGPWMERAGVAEPSRIAEIDSAEQVLAQLPCSELTGILDDFEKLRNPAGRRPEPRDLHYPLETPPRVAVLAPGFRETRSVRLFPDNWSRELKHFRPNSIAAPAGVLRALALAVRDGRVHMQPLTHAVIVFTGIEHGVLRQPDRDLFWKIFQVPLFEQLRGLGGELLAEECEAHHGLHIRDEDCLLELEPMQSGFELVYTSLTSLEYPLVRLATGL
ncbi:MAG: hypothetical protein ABFD86_11505, partial [Bryobacteraceae bacterium]